MSLWTIAILEWTTWQIGVVTLGATAGAHRSFICQKKDQNMFEKLSLVGCGKKPYPT